MKKSLLFIAIYLLITCAIANAGDRLRVLGMQEPKGDQEKRIILVNSGHLQAIIDEFGLEPDASASIELADKNGKPLAVLAKIKKGTIKWDHDLRDGDQLEVKFSKEDFPSMQQIIKENAFRPGLRVQLSESTTKVSSSKMKGIFSEVKMEKEKFTLQWVEVTFAELADLAPMLKYPVNVKPGQAMEDNFAVTVSNNGTVEARDVEVRLVLSRDKNISEGIPLENGRGVIASLAPGQSATLALPGPVIIPADAQPDKYQLGVVVDPENKIPEMDKSNNIYTGFLLVAAPPPKCITMGMAKTQLVFQPNGYGLAILCNGRPISDGKDWRKCIIKPYIFQLRHVSWNDFHWEINTMDRGVYQVRGAPFCKSGGTTEKVIAAPMIVSGGSRSTLPSSVTLKLDDACLIYEPETNKFQILAYGNQLAYLPFWKTCKMKSHVYQIKHELWSDCFWEIDAFNKAVVLVSGGEFMKTGGTRTPLDMELKVEE